MEDGDALLAFLEDNGGAFGAIGLEGALCDGGGQLEWHAGLAGWL